MRHDPGLPAAGPTPPMRPNLWTEAERPGGVKPAPAGILSVLEACHGQPAGTVATGTAAPRSATWRARTRSLACVAAGLIGTVALGVYLRRPAQLPAAATPQGAVPTTHPLPAVPTVSAVPAQTPWPTPPDNAHTVRNGAGLPDASRPPPQLAEWLPVPPLARPAPEPAPPAPATPLARPPSSVRHAPTSTPPHTARHPAKAGSPGATPDADVALLEAVLAHAGLRRPPTSAAEALRQRCAALTGEAAALCRRQVCAQHPQSLVCRD